MEDFTKLEKCIKNYLDEHLSCWGLVAYDKEGKIVSLYHVNCDLEFNAVRQQMEDFKISLDEPVRILNESEEDD